VADDARGAISLQGEAALPACGMHAMTFRARKSSVSRAMGVGKLEAAGFKRMTADASLIDRLQDLRVTLGMGDVVAGLAADGVTLVGRGHQIKSAVAIDMASHAGIIRGAPMNVLRAWIVDVILAGLVAGGTCRAQ